MTVSVDKIIEDYETLLGEHNVLRRKLDSKVQALLILTKELQACRQEKDQFKAMVDHIHSRNPRGKRTGSTDSYILNGDDFQDKSFSDLLTGMKEVNRSLQREAEDLRQKYTDSQGDIKLLREQIARQRVGSMEEGVNVRHFASHEREELVKKLEASKVKYVLLERDFQTVLDEKEELVSERDAYKHKVERLNRELNCVLKGDEKRIIDIDALVMENRYLQERLKQTQEEKSLYLQTLSKYKSILEKKRNQGSLRLGANGTTGMIITHKEVQAMLQNTSLSQLPTTQATIADLRSLALALFESLNDKNTALTHQKKANKILGNRVNELEDRVKGLELELWQHKTEKYNEQQSAVIQRLQLCLSKDHHRSVDLDGMDSSSLNGSLPSTPLTKEVVTEIVRRESIENSSTLSCSAVSPSQPDESECSSPSVLPLMLPEIPSNDSTMGRRLELDVTLNARDHVRSVPDTFNGNGHVSEDDEEEDLPPSLLKLVENALQDLEKEQHGDDKEGLNQEQS